MTTSHKPYDLHASVGFQATLSSRVFERRLEDGLKAIAVSRLQWCILVAIGINSQRRPSDIAQFLGIDRTATSRALRGMEADGLVARTPDTRDRRKTDVALTDQGREKLAQALPIASENTAYFGEKLTTHEAEVLQKLLIKLRRGEENNLSNF
jgi:DNA-binding MarR family transcriptional regulator